MQMNSVLLHMPDFYSVQRGGVCVRTGRALARVGSDTVEGLMRIFAEGAKKSWQRIDSIRNFGTGCKAHLIDVIKSWTIEIPPELCYPTLESPVAALDWCDAVLCGERWLDAQKQLEYYAIDTIGKLIAACEDEDRISGLRYIDADLYNVAIKRLRRYDFEVTTQ